MAAGTYTSCFSWAWFVRAIMTAATYCTQVVTLECALWLHICKGNCGSCYILCTSGYSGVRLRTAYLQGQLWQLQHFTQVVIPECALWQHICKGNFSSFFPSPGSLWSLFGRISAALAVPLVPRAVLPLLRLWPQFKKCPVLAAVSLKPRSWQLFRNAKIIREIGFLPITSRCGSDWVSCTV
jgi:hypothetical protein